MYELIANGVTLPSPISIDVNQETIWSSSTGRSASGLMTGDVIDEKTTYAVKWGILTSEEYEKIRKLPSGFFSLTILNKTITAYRGSIQSGVLVSKNIYYKDVSVTFIQQ